MSGAELAVEGGASVAADGGTVVADGGTVVADGGTVVADGATVVADGMSRWVSRRLRAGRGLRAISPARGLRYLAAFVALAAFLAPLYWLVTISLKREVDQFAQPPLWFGFTPTLEHFRNAFAVKGFGGYFWNSVLVSSVSTLLALALGVPAAYSLVRFPWKGNSAVKVGYWILSNRFLPPIATIVPLFLMARWLGLLNSPLALIVVYTGFNLPFVVWMMMSFFREIPVELEESARMDGDSRLGALVRVVLPLARPGLAATAIFCLIVAWNEFLYALVLTQTESSMTLPIGIAAQVTQYEIRWGTMSAAGVVAMVPVLIFAGFAQRYLVRGLSLGAVKG